MMPYIQTMALLLLTLVMAVAELDTVDGAITPVPAISVALLPGPSKNALTLPEQIDQTCSSSVRLSWLAGG
ncbi:MAG TPA: hypothetical protein VGD98_03060 [Ktedonobacteraceae bacterium]